MLNLAKAEVCDRLVSVCVGREVPMASMWETPVEGGDGPMEAAKSYILY